MGWELMRARTSRNQAKGSTPMSWQEPVKLRRTAAVWPPESLPRKVPLWRPMALPRSERSVALLSMDKCKRLRNPSSQGNDSEG